MDYSNPATRRVLEAARRARAKWEIDYAAGRQTRRWTDLSDAEILQLVRRDADARRQVTRERNSRNYYRRKARMAAMAQASTLPGPKR